MTSHFLDPHSYNPGPFWNPLRFLINAIKTGLDAIQIRTAWQATWICRLIPSHCPFERDIRLGNRTIHIPSFCQINPVYEQLIALRMRAATYLAEVNP